MSHRETYKYYIINLDAQKKRKLTKLYSWHLKNNINKKTKREKNLELWLINLVNVIKLGSF